MNRDTLKGNWKQLKGRIKERWGALTDDDLAQVEGRRDVLIGKLQTRYGMAKDRAERELDQLLGASPEDTPAARRGTTRGSTSRSTRRPRA